MGPKINWLAIFEAVLRSRCPRPPIIFFGWMFCFGKCTSKNPTNSSHLKNRPKLPQNETRKSTNHSGQIIIFHQPRFPWNKEISLNKPPFGVRSGEVAIIWPAKWNEKVYQPSISLVLLLAGFVSRVNSQSVANSGDFRDEKAKFLPFGCVQK